jgi:hypothetical protein
VLDAGEVVTIEKRVIGSLPSPLEHGRAALAPAYRSLLGKSLEQP